MKLKHIFSGILVLGLFDAKALAIFDLQLLVGQRSGSLPVFVKEKLENKDVSAFSTKVAAHIDPIPLIPVSFGFFASQEEYDVSGSNHSMTSLTGYTFGPEVNAWINLGSMQPYARLSYGINALKGKVQIEVSGDSYESDIVYTSSGVHMAAGIAWAPIPSPLKILAEVNFGSETAKNDEFSVNGFDIEETTKNADNTTILIGAEFGI